MILLLAACFTAPQPPSEPTGPYWVQRSDAELEQVLAETCARATKAGKPVLLSFSAEWCGDCNRVRELETQAPLKEELSHWAKLVIDPGRFDRHTEVLKRFGVGSIAYWVAVEPDCGQPLTAWRVLDKSSFEPASDPEAVGGAKGLRDWLVAARKP